ncbi:hypothetical protein [Hymenobacter radiodurans]|uniref:hypothetical protein n=1 Tax=Hymenobacter radiodurans TaxID=2496028 RepID=UPI00105897AD|nr:hypothetical protein [Hymenobacter radiodurans]
MPLIAVVGEAPSDTAAVIGLLVPLFNSDYQFITLLDTITGSKLDEQKTKHLIRKEFDFEKPDIVIFCRDLDGLANERDKKLKMQTYFLDMNRIVRKKGVYLLSVFELETLILADIEKFNSEYECNVVINFNPEEKEKSKDFLKDSTHGKQKQFVEGHNSYLIPKLDRYKIINCSFYEAFIRELDIMLAKRRLPANILDQHNNVENIQE